MVIMIFYTLTYSDSVTTLNGKLGKIRWGQLWLSPVI